MNTTWVQMTHTTTASASSPHSDGRSLTMLKSPVFNGSYALVYTSDGGIYVRDNVKIDQTGDWHTLNGDLAIGEVISASFDPLSSNYVVGLQDNGVSMHYGSKFASKGNEKDDLGTFHLIKPDDGMYTDVDLLDTNGNGTNSRMYVATQFFSAAGFLMDDAVFITLPNMLQANPMSTFYVVNKYRKRSILVCITSSQSDPEGCYSLTPYSSAITPPPDSKTMLTNRFVDRFAYGGVVDGVVDKDLVFGASKNQILRHSSSLNYTYQYSSISWTKAMDLFLSVTSLALHPLNAKQVVVTCMEPDGVFFSRDFGTKRLYV
jgi:hypothetical protein